MLHRPGFGDLDLSANGPLLIGGLALLLLAVALSGRAKVRGIRRRASRVTKRKMPLYRKAVPVGYDDPGAQERRRQHREMSGLRSRF